MFEYGCLDVFGCLPTLIVLTENLIFVVKGISRVLLFVLNGLQIVLCLLHLKRVNVRGDGLH